MNESLFQKGIDYFNNGYFFEAHDTFEELWMDDREESKRFYQGLVQLATGFYHLVMRNRKGAVSQLTKCTEKLADFEPRYKEINVTELIGQVDTCIRAIKSSNNDNGRADLLELIPRLNRE